MPAIPLDPFGLAGPTDVACVAVRYQIAQKLHACTEVFPDGRGNDRFRDLSDLLMLRDLVGDPDLPRVRDACVEIFALRGKHPWPPTVTVFRGWPEQYAALAEQIDFAIRDVHEATEAVEAMVAEIDTAR